MREIVVVSFTFQGAVLGGNVAAALRKAGRKVSLYAKYPTREAEVLKGDIKSLIKEIFERSEGIIFIGAAGAAIRLVAPFLKSKDGDPAVVIIDEKAQFVVPLLSGHLGGANDLARFLAESLEARAVITTSTDVNGVFAIDVWAKKNGCNILDTGNIKHISAAFIKGEAVGFYCDYPIEGDIPGGFTYGEAPLGACVSGDTEKKPFPVTLRITPKVLDIGLGCRKNIPPEVLELAVQDILKEKKLDVKRINSIVSLDIKADEPAVVLLAEKWRVPFKVFSSEELSALQGDFSSSSFVYSVTGTDNVCERAASMGGGKLILKKTVKSGVALACAEREWICRFPQKEIRN